MAPRAVRVGARAWSALRLRLLQFTRTKALGPRVARLLGRELVGATHGVGGSPALPCDFAAAFGVEAGKAAASAGTLRCVDVLGPFVGSLQGNFLLLAARAICEKARSVALRFPGQPACPPLFSRLAVASLVGGSRRSPFAPFPRAARRPLAAFTHATGPDSKICRKPSSPQPEGHRNFILSTYFARVSQRNEAGTGVANGQRASVR
jgi:hypothetical protein